MILLNPGPANTTRGVKEALVCEDVCPRETVFGDLMSRVAAGLAALVDSSGEHVAVLFAGSGTAAVEATLASVVPADGRLLVLDNGAYGARMAHIAGAYGMPHEVEALGVGEPIDPEAVGRRLDRRRFTHLAVVHHETTTGMLNPMEGIGAVCRRRGVEMIVDAMSSYAAIPIDMTEAGADYLVASSNKCIQAMAGLSFVIGRRERIAALPRIPGRSLYLDLGEQHRFFEHRHQMRFTPPVQLFYALEKALEELAEEGGVEARRRRYDECWQALDAGMSRLGFRRLLAEEHLSRILTSYLEPTHPAYSYDALHDHLFDRGFTIYPGKGAKEETFRLANMGAVTPDDLHRFIVAMGETLDEMGVAPLYET